MDWRPAPNAPPPPYPGMAQQAPFPGGPPPPQPPMTMYGGYPPQGAPTYVTAPTQGGPAYATAAPMGPGMHPYHAGYPYGAQYQPGYAYGQSPVIVQQREQQPRNTLLETCGIAACCYALLCCCPRLFCFGCDPDF